VESRERSVTEALRVRRWGLRDERAIDRILEQRQAFVVQPTDGDHTERRCEVALFPRRSEQVALELLARALEHIWPFPLHEHVELVEGDEVRAGQVLRVVQGQLATKDQVLLYGRRAGARRVHDEEDEAHSTQLLQEATAEPLTAVRSFDKTRQVSQHRSGGGPRLLGGRR